MATKVTSGYSAVCGRNPNSRRTRAEYGSGMMKRAYDETNPLAPASGGMMKPGGAAFNASKSYKCVTCGSKMGANSEQTGSVSMPEEGVSTGAEGPEAGWYGDPHAEARRRYWDGLPVDRAHL